MSTKNALELYRQDITEELNAVWSDDMNSDLDSNYKEERLSILSKKSKELAKKIISSNDSNTDWLNILAHELNIIMDLVSENANGKLKVSNTIDREITDISERMLEQAKDAFNWLITIFHLVPDEKNNVISFFRKKWYQLHKNDFSHPLVIKNNRNYTSFSKNLNNVYYRDDESEWSRTVKIKDINFIVYMKKLLDEYEKKQKEQK